MTTPESPKFLSEETSKLRGSDRWSNITDVLAINIGAVSGAAFTYGFLIRHLSLAEVGVGGILLAAGLKHISGRLQPHS